MLNEKLIKIQTKDGEQIALWKITAATSSMHQHIFLGHGTFSNKKVCMGIAAFLVEQGYTCWIVEWRNHGESPQPKQHFNYETIALYDFLAAFDFLFEVEKIQSLSCITHSGGGICLSMFLIRNPQYIPKIERIALFGCQSFGAADSLTNYTKIFLGKYLTALTQQIPAEKKGLGDHNENYFLMKQWFDWNLSKQFNGADNFDYLKSMPLVTTPILSICAKGDTFIAPVKGCKAFLNGFKNPKNKLLFCSKENGYLEDYDHSRILHSSSAKKEIWPIVLNWIQQ